MKNTEQIVGIIAEYHPFHNGHLYQMRNARALTGAAYCVVLLSGSFVQRGTSAVWSTAVRAEAALRCGADAVFGIPSPFSSASARDYALYGVSLLSGLGIPFLSCGAESADAEELTSLLRCVDENSESFRETLREGLKSGMSYPEARLNAVQADLTAAGADPFLLSRTREILSEPNNILAYEYAHAIRALQSGTRLVTVKRTGAGYHDPVIRGSFASASAIRSHILSGGDPGDLESVIPGEALRLISSEPALPPDALCGPVLRRIENLLYEGADLSVYEDVSQDLAERIRSTSRRASSFDELVRQLKTRQYTYTRIARALIHLFLGVQKSSMADWKSERPAPYAYLLGFRRESSELLGILKERTAIPIISRPAAYRSCFSPGSAPARLFEAEIHAQNLWNSLCLENSGREYPDLLRQQMIVV